MSNYGQSFFRMVSEKTYQTVAVIGDGLASGIIDEELIKSFPILGTLASTYGSYIGIRDAVYLKKLQNFLIEIDKINEDLKLEFIAQNMADPMQQERFGMTVFKIVESNEDARKFTLYSALFEHMFMGEVSYSDTMRLCIMIDKAFYDDIVNIINIRCGEIDNEPYAEALQLNNFIKIKGLDFGGIDSDGSELKKGVIYEKNKLGHIMTKVVKAHLNTNDMS
ncbi:hypothetical protein ABXV18_24805 [Vibrio owensii]|uniref:hypothetical protein n=1 Tax=Vibrio owensii TaxID=696485 RepID=UPI0033984A23